MNRRQTARSRAGGVFACVACLVWSILSRASDDDVPTKDARRLLATVSLAARANGLQAVPQRDDTWLFRRPGGPLMARAFGPDVLVAWMRVGSDASVITDWNQHEVRTAAFEDSAGRAVLRWSLPSGPVWPAAMVRTKFASFLRDIERFDAAMNEALGLEETPNVEFLRGPQDCPPLDARGGRSVGFGPIGPGTIVIPLSRQPLVADPPIEQPSFVGHRTQVRALAGVDENGCPLVVFADSPVRWRVRDVLDVAVDGEREGPPTQPEMVVFAKRKTRGPTRS